MNNLPTPAIVSTSWLQGQLNNPRLRILDASWSLPNTGQDTKANYLKEHISTAQFFDIDGIADHDGSLPHMLPNSKFFERSISALGISNTDHVIVYDSAGLYSGARVWWMFRVFGHTQISVLDGGFPKWQREQRPVDKGFQKPTPREYVATDTSTLLVRTLQQVHDAISQNTEQVVDARSKGRFEGKEPEVRPGVRSGHIPGSINLPYDRLIAKDGTLLPSETIRSVFINSGVDLSRPVITSCGSGITAAVLALGLHTLGCEEIAIYDGSWCEWGSQPNLYLKR